MPVTTRLIIIILPNSHWGMTPWNLDKQKARIEKRALGVPLNCPSSSMSVAEVSVLQGAAVAPVKQKWGYVLVMGTELEQTVERLVSHPSRTIKAALTTNANWSKG